MYDSSSNEMKTVYSSLNVFEKKRAVHSEIKDFDGKVIGRTFHEEPPPPNAQYVKRTTNVPSRLSMVNDYRREYGGKREEARPFPKKESDLNEAKQITSRRVDHNARRALHGGQLNGEMPCEKEWDNLPASYMKKGYDSRTPSEKIYIPPFNKGGWNAKDGKNDGKWENQTVIFRLPTGESGVQKNYERLFKQTKHTASVRK